MTHRRRAVTLLAALALVASLSGCQQAEGKVVLFTQVGKVSGGSYAFNVRTSDGRDHVVNLKPGEQRSLTGLPFGKITINAKNLCVLEGQLSSTVPSFGALFGPKSCDIRE